MKSKKRKNSLTGSISFLLALTLLNQLAFPTVAWALTGGPSQPEVQSFEPIGTTQMVDPFSGDFVYNIPLMDVDGYPLNISYHSGIGMDQEASWVGLGWNLNVGSINRSMRGLPDDFDGKDDAVVKEHNIEKNWTFGVGIDNTFEFVGMPMGKYFKGRIGFGINTNIFYNNYKGMGIEFGTSHSTGVSVNNQSKNFSAGPNLSAQLSLNSQEGLGIDHSLGLNASIGNAEKRQVNMGINMGRHYNTRAGIKERKLSASLKYTGKSGRYIGTSTSSTLPVGNQSYVPQVNMPMSNFSFSGSLGLGPEAAWGAYLFGINISYSKQELAKRKQEQPAYGYLFSDDAGNDKKALYDINREKDGEYTPNLPMLPVTNFTYDVFSVTGQGIGGIYRPYRNDKGVVGDPHVEDGGEGGNAGVDIAFAAYLKLGG
ncbi:MAG TPA: hypothetical protein VLB84_06900, partial [Bacteroidia bacterium]|nr:hypothetical protein [Bacteroidia bacterium]